MAVYAFIHSEFSKVPLLGRPASRMREVVVSTEGVIKLLKVLNPSKAMDADKLHHRILNELAVELGPVFAYLFQKTIGLIPKNSL